MIAKIVPGTNFKGAIDYITDIFGKDKQKKGARIICHSDSIPPGADNRTMGILLDSYARKGDHNIGDPVHHFILSFSKYDAPKLTDELMSRIFQEFLSRMGYKNTEFLAARHQSRKNPHLHGITLRIDRDGNVISDAFEIDKANRIALELTKKYGLHISSGKVDVSRDRLRGRDKAKYKIYDAVSAAMKNTDTWDKFYEALEKQDVQMKFHINNVTGKLLGISFSTDGFSFSGKSVDRSMTLAKLEEQFGKLNEIVHENVHDYYEDRWDEYINALPYDKRSSAMKLYKPFVDFFPNGVPELKLLMLGCLWEMLSTMTALLMAILSPQRMTIRTSFLYSCSCSSFSTTTSLSCLFAVVVLRSRQDGERRMMKMSDGSSASASIWAF